MSTSFAVRRHRRLPGLDIRPGSVKQARAAAGLSLAQVAGKELSRTAVHLVETGRTRPTLATLKLIASRTGKPLDFFIDPGHAALVGIGEPVDLTKLRQLAAGERFSELLATARDLLETATSPIDDALIRFYLGLAHVKAGEPEPGLRELRSAKATFEAHGDRWMVVECQDWEAAALDLVESPSALAVAQAALAECRDLDPVPSAVEARLLGRIAGIHFTRQEQQESIRCYAEAIEAAESLKDLTRIAKLYASLGDVYQEMGDLQRATVYAHKALAIEELVSDQSMIAPAENNFGVVLMRHGDLKQAEEHLRRSLDLCTELGLEHGKSTVLLSLAELMLDREQAGQAIQYIDQAVDLAGPEGEQATLAHAHQLRAQASEVEGRREAADREFQMAISLLEQGRVISRLVACLNAYARILEARGDTQGALAQLKRIVAVTRPDLTPGQAVEMQTLDSARA